MRAFHPGYPPVSPEEAGWWGARFLQRFFAIHPFADGNGRIARLLLIWGIEESGDLRVLEDWFACGAEAKYVRALEFAHEHSPNEGRRDDHGKNYLRKLAAWLRGRVAVIGDDLGDEVLEENVE